MQFRHIKIGLRAAVMFILIGLLVALLGLVALYETRRMDSASDEIRAIWMPAVIVLGDIGRDVGRARALTMRSILEEQASAREATLAEVDGINSACKRAWRSMKAPSTSRKTGRCSMPS